jgi:hypothetical protein
MALSISARSSGCPISSDLARTAAASSSARGHRLAAGPARVGQIEDAEQELLDFPGLARLQASQIALRLEAVGVHGQPNQIGGRENGDRAHTRDDRRVAAGELARPVVPAVRPGGDWAAGAMTLDIRHQLPHRGVPPGRLGAQRGASDRIQIAPQPGA